MNLYRMTAIHYGPKDSHEATAALLLSKDDAGCFDWMKRHSHWEYWSEGDDDGFGEIWRFGSNAVAPADLDRARALGLTIEGDASDCEIKGRSDLLCLWNRGDFQEPQDCYYGTTHHRWELIRKVTHREISVLLSLGLAEWSPPASQPDDDQPAHNTQP